MAHEAQIRQMTEDGFAIKRIAKILQYDANIIKTFITNNNITNIKEVFHISKIPHIIDLYNKGVSAKSLGYKYSIGKGKIQGWAKNAGILRNKEDSHRFTFFDDHIFDIIDTPEKAYWLGFFYADAYNGDMANTFNIVLKDADHNHLLKLAKFTGLPTEKVIRKTGIKYPTCHLTLYSKHLCSKMTELGCMRAKSFIIIYPKWLDPKLNNHFIRGMFDGDGCLTYRKNNNEWKWSLVSTKEGCADIQTIIQNEVGISVRFDCISQTNNNTYDFETGGNEKISKLMDWLHKGSEEHMRLDRKYQKYIDLKTQQNNRRFSRKEYKVSQENTDKILLDIANGCSIFDIAKKFEVHPRTITKIKQKTGV